MINYKDSGVDIKKGELLVEKLKMKVKQTYGPRVISGVGGFASLFQIAPGKLLAAGADGVGTKIKVAQTLGIYDTIGIDLVAMCVNDLLCTGARPLFFMDYLAVGKLDVRQSEELVFGMAKGCLECQTALIGGETAEMPDLYQTEDFDLAGFAVGEVLEKDLIDGRNLVEGDILVALPSSGLHSNGFSLVRKLIKETEINYLKMALTPTRIYHTVLDKIFFHQRGLVKGLAHITGGGLKNVARMNSSFDYVLEPLPLDEIPAIFSLVKDRSKLSDEKLYQTFNMGIGFVMATDRPKELFSLLGSLGEKFWPIGTVNKGNGRVLIKNSVL